MLRILVCGGDNENKIHTTDIEYKIGNDLNVNTQ